MDSLVEQIAGMIFGFGIGWFACLAWEDLKRAVKRRGRG